MNAFDCESVKTGTIAYLLAKRMSAQKPLIEFFLSTQTELWQTWCMRRTENPENVVRFHEAPLKNSGVLQWQRGWTVNPLSDGFVGSSPTSRTQIAL